MGYHTADTLPKLPSRRVKAMATKSALLGVEHHIPITLPGCSVQELFPKRKHPKDALTPEVGSSPHPSRGWMFWMFCLPLSRTDFTAQPHLPTVCTVLGVTQSFIFGNASAAGGARNGGPGKPRAAGASPAPPPLEPQNRGGEAPTKPGLISQLPHTAPQGQTGSWVEAVRN